MLENKVFDRKEAIMFLRHRDGDCCRHPKCGKPIDFSLTDGRMMPTIDHREPQSWCRENGWSEAEIWSMSNLDLMHRHCNASKGEMRYLEDGTLPEKPMSRFKYRRLKRASRAEYCKVCDNGNNLAHDEMCSECDSAPQKYPKWAQVAPEECPHEGVWSCFACIVGLVQRKPAYIDVFDIENSGIVDS